jgi:hypothetical protein
VVVVGASAGVGRAFAVRAGKEGARLVLAARRADKLDEVVAEAGVGTTVAVDVRDPADCNRLGEVARETLGQIDILLISSGYAPLKMITDTDAQDCVTCVRDERDRRSRDHPRPSAFAHSVGDRRGAVVGFGPLSTHRARCLLVEQGCDGAMPRVVAHGKTGYRFSCVEISGTVPTDFTSAFDPDLLGTALTEWLARGLGPGEPYDSRKP